MELEKNLIRATRWTKAQQKLVKKQFKKVSALLRDFQRVKVSESPTSTLFVGNGGLLCGYSRETILSKFSRFGAVCNLRMFPGKSFAILSFSDVEDARKALEESRECLQTAASGSMFLTYLTCPDDFDDLNLSSGGCPHLDDNVYPACDRVPNVPGLEVCDEFIAPDYEDKLLNFFNTADTASATPGGFLKHRSVSHYGFEFLYHLNDVDRSNPLDQGVPDVCQPIIDKLLIDRVVDWVPDQLTVNRYAPGQGIPPHVDTHSAFEDGILSLSLGSQVTMDFRHPDGARSAVNLRRRSLVVMKGESRYLWTHGITPRKYDIVFMESSCARQNKDASAGLTLVERGMRTSLTFRKVRHAPCACRFPSKCDSQVASAVSERGKTPSDRYLPHSTAEAVALEHDHVCRVYEEIAEHFSDTRHTPWPIVKQFLLDLAPGSLVADVGCGNGKYLGINPTIAKLGSDQSSKLASVCRERGFQVVVSDCLRLPYRSNAFDGAICIAVIHHLSTAERRLDAIKELCRVVRPGGVMLIYVWAMEQEGGDMKHDVPPVDGEVNVVAKASPGQVLIRVNEKRNVFMQQDLLIPWHLKSDAGCDSSSDCENVNQEADGQVFHRYYHVFKAGELSSLCSNVSTVRVKKEYLDKGNWCVLLEKI